MIFSLFCSFLVTQAYANNGLTITTWNLGLAHSYVRYASQRIPPIIEALKKHDTDVLCVQEVWNQEDIDILKNSLKDIYTYNFVMPFKQKKAKQLPACGAYRFLGPHSVGLCLLSKCRKKVGDELTDCVLNTCGKAIDRLKKKDRICAEAFFAQVGKSAFKGFATVLTPLKRAGLFTYEGSNGLAIFSKYPLLDVTGFSMDNESTLSRRSVLYANVKKDNQNHHVACTHLSANLANVPYTGLFESWVDESYHQAQLMTAMVEEKAGTEPIFLAGDFNCSFEDLAAGIAPEATKTCGHFISEGYFSKMLEQAECTFCESNTLVLDAWEKDKMIDHIFVKNVDTSKLATQVIMKEPVTIKNEAGVDILSNLSDHFGVHLESFK